MRMLRVSLICMLCIGVLFGGTFPHIKYPTQIVKIMTSYHSRFIVFGGLYIVLLTDIVIGTLLGILVICIDSNIQNHISIGKRY